VLFLISKFRSGFFTLIELSKNRKFELVKSLIKGNLDAIRNIPLIVSKRTEIQTKKTVSEENFKIWLK